MVEIVDSPKAPSIDLWVGIHDSAHATALGKCILGALDDRTRADYLARHPLHPLTRRTVTDRATLEHEIRDSPLLTRDDEEYALGVHCMAAPVVTTDLVGAVAVARHEQRAPRTTEYEVAAAIQRSAARMQRTFGLAHSA